MIKRYATKVNKNGWNYQLEIDITEKAFKYGTYLFPYADCQMTKKQLDEIVSLLIADGYTKINE